VESGRSLADDRRVLCPHLHQYDTPEPGFISCRGVAAHRHRSGACFPAWPRSSGPLYGHAEVAAGATLHPVIEVVDSRYADFRSLDRPSILADNFSNGGLVYGAAAPNWEGLDLHLTKIIVTEDGEPFADSSQGAARDPVAALVDFANLMRERDGIKAGTIVTTGSWTGMVFTRRGARIVADFGPIGQVEVVFHADE
jgi:2-keto-4-pentenoate hydratase